MPTDLNQRAKAIVELATGEREVEDPDEGKNPAAVELGRLGGLKGGEGSGREAVDKRIICGQPDEDLISTSYVERQNLTMRMGMRRFTRLTNAFSKKVENHAHAVALHFLHYNFARPHQSLGKQTTPAMAAGVANYPWSLTQVAGLLEGRIPN